MNFSFSIFVNLAGYLNLVINDHHIFSLAYVQYTHTLSHTIKQKQLF